MALLCFALLYSRAEDGCKEGVVCYAMFVFLFLLFLVFVVLDERAEGRGEGR